MINKQVGVRPVRAALAPAQEPIRYPADLGWYSRSSRSVQNRRVPLLDNPDRSRTAEIRRVTTTSAIREPLVSSSGTSAWSPPKMITGYPSPAPSADARSPHHTPVGSRIRAGRPTCSSSSVSTRVVVVLPEPRLPRIAKVSVTASSGSFRFGAILSRVRVLAMDETSRPYPLSRHEQFRRCCLPSWWLPQLCPTTSHATHHRLPRHTITPGWA